MARGSRVCCAAADGFGPYWWQTSLSVCGHTPAPGQHLLPFVAALSPQAHESAAALASIYFRMVIRRLWWDSRGSKVIPLSGSERGDRFSRELAELRGTQLENYRCKWGHDQIRWRLVISADGAMSWLTARVTDNSTQTPQCDLSTALFEPYPEITHSLHNFDKLISLNPQSLFKVLSFGINMKTNIGLSYSAGL